VAQSRPDLPRRVILAEPGGALDASIAPADMPTFPSMRAATQMAAEKITGGDIDGGLAAFNESVGICWNDLSAATKQMLRDNAMTLPGQVNEQREPFTRADAEAIRVPALFIGGGASLGPAPVVPRALAAHVPGARTEIIPHTSHVMFEQDPVRFCDIVLESLDRT
jgi:esterase